MRYPVLVAFDHVRPKDPPFSLGVASIAASLYARRIPFGVHRVNVSRGGPHVVAGALRHAFGYKTNRDTTDVIVGAFVWNEPYVQAYMEHLKRGGFRGRIGVAGAQVSYASAGTLEALYPHADFFIRGFAEDAVVDLATDDQDAGVRGQNGLHWAHDHAGDYNVQGKSDLSVLPSPYLQEGGYILKPTDFMRWETVRGCPYTCSFCQHRAAGRGGKTMISALRRVDHEIVTFCSDPVGRKAEIAVVDPTFNAVDERSTNILEMFRMQGFKGRLELQIRPEKLTSQFIGAAVNLGHPHVVFEMGVQTMIPAELAVIDRIKGADAERNVSLVHRKLDMVRRAGVQAEISLIYGLPGQTVESFRESIEVCRKLVPHAQIKCFPLMLLRGTKLHAQASSLGLKEGFVEHPWITPRIQEFIPHVVETPSMTREDWKRMADLAQALGS